MHEEYLQKLAESIVECDPEAAEALAQQALTAGIEPMTIIEQGLMKGMRIVGENFQCGEAFLPDLIIAAESMKRAMTLLEPELHLRQQSIASAGVVVLGTVKGDIHEIGKTLVGTMLSASGFTVHDLGTDVATDTFIHKVKETGAHLLGLSSLLTTTMVVQREVIQALTQAGLREQVKVIVGGAPVTQAWAHQIGADGYAEDATGAVEVARQLLSMG
jgi:corrinoid protein of di/trimethylamine methyltransferase